MADAAGSSSQNCPDGSVVAERYATGKWRHRAGQRVPESYPSNTAVLRAVYNRVSVCVGLQSEQNGRHQPQVVLHESTRQTTPNTR